MIGLDWIGLDWIGLDRVGARRVHGRGECVRAKYGGVAGSRALFVLGRSPPCRGVGFG